MVAAYEVPSDASCPTCGRTLDREPLREESGTPASGEAGCCRNQDVGCSARQLPSRRDAKEKEAERLADEHLRSAPGGLDRRRVVQMIKQRLAEERRFSL